MGFPRRIRRGLIEAPLRSPWWTGRLAFPRRIRRGLIEASSMNVTGSLASSCFRGEFAAASLKRRVTCHTPKRMARFRGEFAAASLRETGDRETGDRPRFSRFLLK